MFWLISILVIFILILCLVLLSVIVIEVDTRIPQAGFRWGNLGTATIWYDDEWWLGIQVLFYRKKIRMSAIKRKSAKIQVANARKKPAKKRKLKDVLRKVFSVVKTFEVIECKLAIDTNDYAFNAQLFPLNFLPKGGGHIFINFNNENFFVLKVINYPWKILYSFFKK